MVLCHYIGGLLLLSGLLLVIFESICFEESLNIFFTIRTNVGNDYQNNMVYPDQARRWGGIRQRIALQHVQLGVLSIGLSIVMSKLATWLSWDVINNTVDYESLILLLTI